MGILVLMSGWFRLGLLFLTKGFIGDNIPWLYLILGVYKELYIVIQFQFDLHMKKGLILAIYLLLELVAFGQTKYYTQDENETSLKMYLDSSKLDKIEGIYKTVSGTYYKLGIKKIDDVYVAINLESETKGFKKGDVKAIFEQSVVDGVFSTKWFMSDKSPNQTIATMESAALIKILLPTGLAGSNEETFLMKMYPPLQNKDKKSSISVLSSGSGFVVSSNGLIATNAHVIENAKSISVKFKTDIGTMVYNAKVELVDNRNDVAILKIDDVKFTAINVIPYSLIEKSEIGEKVFTIGYPLNDIMGSNYKLTDGLISSNTGIGDDLRYYQISVPIQPGNSGGPLFNNEGTIVGLTSAKLNSKTVGTNVENVNYAIKIQYLNNILNMIPSYKLLVSDSSLKGKELKEQVKVLKNFICLIEVSE